MDDYAIRDAVTFGYLSMMISASGVDLMISSRWPSSSRTYAINAVFQWLFAGIFCGDGSFCGESEDKQNLDIEPEVKPIGMIEDSPAGFGTLGFMVYFIKLN